MVAVAAESETWLGAFDYAVLSSPASYWFPLLVMAELSQEQQPLMEVIEVAEFDTCRVHVGFVGGIPTPHLVEVAGAVSAIEPDVAVQVRVPDSPWF